MLRRTDPSTEDVSMFHYPSDFFPRLEIDDMSRALEAISENRVEDIIIEEEGGEAVSSRHAWNARPEARVAITRMQFSWYQFDAVPREILGRAYPNLCHLDIRQNASLTCIDSLVSQLPNLASLNLSDCPNLRTLAPIALDPEHGQGRRRLRSRLRHLWVRGCDLSGMTDSEWDGVFEALAASEGPLERLTLSRNGMTCLHPSVGKLASLVYLFVEDNCPAAGTTRTAITRKAAAAGGFSVPDELGDLSSLRFLSLCGNGIIALPRTIGRLADDCDLYLHRNPDLSYPPAHEFPNGRGVVSLRRYFLEERMALLRGAVHLVPHLRRARWRAVERLYRPGGLGFLVCKERFEETERRISISMVAD
jgi:Leucine-rich repeat (LRR) protein